jgi:hypothetical protein
MSKISKKLRDVKLQQQQDSQQQQQQQTGAGSSSSSSTEEGDLPVLSKTAPVKVCCLGTGPKGKSVEQQGSMLTSGTRVCCCTVAAPPCLVAPLAVPVPITAAA